MCGDAIEVPLYVEYPPGVLEYVSTPGAAMSGLIAEAPEGVQFVGPREEKLAIGERSCPWLVLRLQCIEEE